MNWKKDEWKTYLLVTFLTVITLVGGQLLWHKYKIAKPLDTSLKTIQGVESVEWLEDDKNENAVVTVKLTNVDNLQKTYGELKQKIKSSLGRKSFEIRLQDNRTPELEKFYYNIHYLVQEAIHTGKFVNMAEQIQTKAQTAAINAKVFVDTDYIYLQFTTDKNNFYMVVSRASKSQEVR